MHSRVVTVAELIDEGERALTRAGVVCAQDTASCRDEAAAIVYDVLGLDHADPAAYGREVECAAAERCRALLRRRVVERLPSAYLLGSAWFAGLRFQVDRRVLIPRSPFAALIAACFEPWFTLPPSPRILEVGTGSGCIAIACARAFEEAHVVATDLDPGALAVARANVAGHGLAERVTLLRADLLDGIGGRFDLIISNPPYVPLAEIAQLPAEFGWEPSMALDGGMDGLDLVRRIVEGARERLAPDGWLALEVGAGAAALEAAFPRVPFLWPQFEDGADGIALVAAADLPRHNAGKRTVDSGS